MLKLKRFIFTCFAMLFVVILNAQDADMVRITGKVIDDVGLPLLGASVYIKGTTTGTSTDLDGAFELRVSPDDQIVISYTGFITKTLTVNEKRYFEITLETDLQSLEEVVIVGYGQVKKSDLTGSVSSVSAKAINDIPTPFLDKALQGQAAGVQITTASAAPGGGAQIRIRGANSLISGSDPLIVIDGYPAGVGTNVIQTLNPQDIKSIEILKDASATSVYGSRGANGVILISTKRGESGKMSIQYSSFFSVEEMNSNLNLLNGEEFAMIYNEFLENTGNAPFYDGSNRYQPLPENAGVGTNWVDAITENGFVSNHQISLSGGSENTKYSVSASYIDHEGVITGGKFNRGVLRVNLDNKLTDWLSAGTSINLNRNMTVSSGDNTDMEEGRGTINSAIKMTPVLPVFDVNGNYTENNIPTAQRRENALAQALEVDNRNTADNVFANVFLNIKPLDGLDIKLSGGANISNGLGKNYNSTKTVEGRNAGGIAFISNNSRSNFLFEGVLTYNKKFEDHDLTFTGLVSRQTEVSESSQMRGSGFPSDLLGANNLFTAEEISNVSSFKSKWQLASYMGRVNYNIMDKYLITATVRADGSSRFGPDNKWGVFPSLAVGWKIQEEEFFKNFTSTINEAKLRLSYGTVGNSEFGLYRSQSLLNLNANAVIGGGVAGGTAPQTNPGNPDLKWETTAMYNLGLDLGFWKNRLKVSIDGYIKETDDFLLGLPLPQTSGYTNITKNIDATIQTKGIDLFVDYNILTRKDFNWNVTGNLSAYKSIYSRFNENDGQLFLDNTYIAEGVEVGVFRGRIFNGIFRSQEEIQAYVGPDGNPIMPQAQPGDIRWVDLNNDGIINVDDADIIGNPNPDFTWGVTNTVKYKNFNLSFLFTGSVGNDIRNTTGQYLGAVSVVRNNLSRQVLDRFHPVNNPNGNYVALGGLGQMPFIEDGTYLRLQNIRLSYNIPTKFKFISNMSVYFTATNLFVITDYSGFDPDINTRNAQDGTQRPLSLGRDNSAFPRPRVFTLGYNINF